MRVAVVDSTDWARVTNVPYGLPTNSGPGIDKLLLAAATPQERVGARQLPGGRVSDFLAIGHEGGHLLAWELLPGPMKAAIASSAPPSAEIMDRFMIIGQIPAWYWEMAANYFTTAFLEANHPDGAEGWREYLRQIAAIDRPRFTHVGDWFGAVIQATAPDSTPYVFSAEGGLNQGWYQAVVGQVAAHLYERAGLNFITHVRSTLGATSAPTKEELVDQLETIAPGVIDLLRALGAEWRS